jgi:catechol-2,3-dioxygenase
MEREHTRGLVGLVDMMPVTGSYSGIGRAIVQSQLNHIALHVPDIEQATRFYTEMFGF